MTDGFFKRWKKGMMELTPAQLLHGQFVGYVGGIFGLLFAMVFMFINGLWYFVFFMSFTIFLQIIQCISVKQKYDAIVKMMETIENTVKENGNKPDKTDVEKREDNGELRKEE